MTFHTNWFKQFATNLYFTHIKTSPHLHKENGMVERANQTVRHLIKKFKKDNNNFYLALLNLRNTPRHTDTGSPAQSLFGRRTKTKLPTNEALLKPKVMEPENVRYRLNEYRNTAKRYYNRGSRPLMPLQTEDTIRVWSKDRWQPYKICIPSGSIL